MRVHTCTKGNALQSMVESERGEVSVHESDTVSFITIGGWLPLFHLSLFNLLSKFFMQGLYALEDWGEA